MKRRTFIGSALAASGVVLAGSATYAYRSSFAQISREQLFFPAMKKKLRIVAVSDIHLPSSFLPLENLIKRINLESPDIFILAGDTIEKRACEELVRAFGAIEAPLAKLTILGNWEYRAQLDLTQLRKEYEKCGFLLLVNKEVQISGLTIIGLDDFVHGSPNYKIVQHTPTKSPLLVVSHCPESFDSISAVSPNPLVVISGHTHGGQITPFGFVFYLPPGSGPYLKGWYHKGKHSMYVMRGVGTSGIPLRIGARPELLILDLVGAEK